MIEARSRLSKRIKTKRVTKTRRAKKFQSIAELLKKMSCVLNISSEAVYSRIKINQYFLFGAFNSHQYVHGNDSSGDDVVDNDDDA